MRKTWIAALATIMVLGTGLVVHTQQTRIPLGNILLVTDDTGALRLDTSAGACTPPYSNPRAGGNVRVSTDASNALIVCGNFGGGGGGDVSSDTIWNAAGDIVVGTGSDTAARLAKGTALQYLRVNSGATALEWATFAITSANITDGQIVNADVSGSAAIAYSKLALSGAIVTGDITDGTIANADVSGSAAIAFSKLNISLSNVLGLYTGTPDGSKFLRDDGSWQSIPGGGDALVANPLSQFASTTSSQFKGVISDENAPDGASSKVLMALGSLSIASGKTGTISNTLTFAGTDGSTVTLGAGGTVVYTSNFGTGVGTFLATPSIVNFFSALTGEASGVETFLTTASSANLAALLSDEAGTAGGFLRATAASTSVAFDIVTLTTDEAFDDTGWNGDLSVPTKNAIRDYLATFLSFTDPNADGILVWDDSIGALVPAVIGSGLSFDGTTLTSSGGTGLGSSLTSTTNDILASTGNDVVLGKSGGEAITLGFATSNTLTLSSTTGLNGINFGSMTATGLVYDAEGSSNTLTIPTKIQFNAGVCQNATASLGFSTPTTLGAVAGCHSVAAASGDPAYGFATFPSGGANTEVHGQFELPSDFTGAIDVTLKWNAVNTTANDVVWTIDFGCVADGEAATAISFNNTAFSAVTNKGTTLQFNTSTKTGITTTGCAAGETAFFKIMRDTDTSGDTLDQDVQLISAVFTVRRAM